MEVSIHRVSKVTLNQDYYSQEGFQIDFESEQKKELVQVSVFIDADVGVTAVLQELIKSLTSFVENLPTPVKHIPDEIPF